MHSKASVSFNPKREARPSQTPFAPGQLRHQDIVSIPNGKPGPLRRICFFLLSEQTRKFQSQTGSQALSDEAYGCRINSVFIRFNPKREARPSQTQSQRTVQIKEIRFNPKREARPSQTYYPLWQSNQLASFQSQTGSQALSDRHSWTIASCPLPSFNPKREARPSQTK